MDASGAQGRGLVRAILADRNSLFKVRAVTRDADSDNAKALELAGAEVVVADIDDTESMKNVIFNNLTSEVYLSFGFP